MPNPAHFNIPHAPTGLSRQKSYRATKHYKHLKLYHPPHCNVDHPLFWEHVPTHEYDAYLDMQHDEHFEPDYHEQLVTVISVTVPSPCIVKHGGCIDISKCVNVKVANSIRGQGF